MRELPALPPVDLRARIASSERIRRIIPRSASYLLLRLVNERRWRDAAYRNFCVESMRFLMGEAQIAPNAEGLAKSFGYHTLKRGELLWRPWLSRRMPVDGLEEAAAAVKHGQGVIASVVHHAWYPNLLGALSDAAIQPYVVAADYFFEEPVPGYLGRRTRQHLLLASRYGRVVPASNSYAHLCELLAAGEIVSLAIDVPGRTPTSLMGRTIFAASGVARLSIATGALVIPVTMWRHRDLARIRLESPLDPADFDSYLSLHAAVMASHEPAIAAWPEAFEYPLSRRSPADPDRVVAQPPKG